MLISAAWWGLLAGCSEPPTTADNAAETAQQIWGKSRPATPNHGDITQTEPEQAPSPSDEPGNVAAPVNQGLIPTTAEGLQPQGAEGLTLQVGDFLTVQLSSKVRVLSYSTTKTYNTSQLWMWELPRFASSLPELLNTPGRCQGAQFRTVTVGDRSYCHGTPSEPEWLSATSGGLPRDHIWFFEPGSWGGGEAYAVQVTDSAASKQELPLSLTSVCLGAKSSGNTKITTETVTSLPGWRISDKASWCQLRDQRARLWWAIQLSAVHVTADARLNVLYVAPVSATSSFGGQKVRQLLSELHEKLVSLP